MGPKFAIFACQIFRLLEMSKMVTAAAHPVLAFCRNPAAVLHHGVHGLMSD